MVEIIGGDIKITESKEPKFYVVATKRNPDIKLFPRTSSSIEPKWAIIKDNDGYILSRNFLPLRYKMDDLLYDEKGISERYENYYHEVETIVTRLNEGKPPFSAVKTKGGFLRNERFIASTITALALIGYLIIYWR
ncbi:hypothetical protein MOC16_gp122 [Klebsiella phage vB_KpM_FBKp24]|uniref:Uncharacterized protein n=1 Tax=Klebsiella phage vB_KpM_FBKp24 TaxID=2801834 RepID=A0A7U0J6T7_9CAUD|nr:hypothetical protein MOC16_gp122 [Klebsiella phage vB_KpM_FBKp24]QQV92231.1 hypothetical protein vBKpMFBKp24_291 [Klebsiella phage vB_KpM_FBKp24]